MPVLNPNALIENRTDAVVKYHQQAGTGQAELDVSGGIDSAVELGIACMALGARNVTAVYMGIHSSDESLRRAKEVAEHFDVRLVVLDLTEAYNVISNEALVGLLRADHNTTEVGERCKNDPTVEGSFRSCLRAPVGRFLNRLTGGGIRHGTGNECEDRYLRFFQKGGDGEVDCNPLAMLSKGEVYQLAVALGIPDSIIDAKPSPDLWGKGEEAHNDEDELFTWAGAPFTYSRVDPKTGEYTKVGTIERVSRFLDQKITGTVDWDNPRTFSVQKWLFDDEREPDWGRIVAVAMGDYPESLKEPLGVHNELLFKGFLASEIGTLLCAARKVERMTRHKWNPNCPSLGTRDELVEARILTNTLPDPKTGEENDG